jgi:hypothetical protein
VVYAVLSNGRGRAVECDGADARGSWRRGHNRRARTGLPDPAVPSHGLAAAPADMPLHTDLQSVRRRGAHRIRRDSGGLAGGTQARQVWTMASGRMGPDTGARLRTPRLPGELRRHQRRRGRPGAARGE